MGETLGAPAGSWDGVDAGAIAAACGVPAVHCFEETASTMDVAHRLAAAGSPGGVLVLAERQSAARGRGGHAWASAPGTTLSMSLIERPLDAAAVGVVSLRLGIRAAEVLSRYAPDLQVKWPNDLLRTSGKVGGILVEARWRGPLPDWVVIGLGLNISAAPWPGSASLAFHGPRLEILAELVPALRAAASAAGTLSSRELERWHARDWARGRAVVAPARGIVRGIDADGSLQVETPAGVVRCASGSLVLAED